MNLLERTLGETAAAISYEFERWVGAAALVRNCSSIASAFNHAPASSYHRDTRPRRWLDPIDECEKNEPLKQVNKEATR